MYKQKGCRVLKSVCKGVKVDDRLVWEAMSEWLANEAGRKNRDRVEKEYGSRENLVRMIVDGVSDRSISFPEITTKVRNEDGKDREIGVEDVLEQVCEYVVIVAIKPLIDRLMGHWQLNREGMGQFKAAPRIQKWMRDCSSHCHADVHHCYGTMKVDKVLAMVDRYVASPDIRWLCRRVLESYPDGHLMIGSCLSMRLANLAMSFAYRDLLNSASYRRGKRIRNVRHVCMYADDVWVFGDSKTGLNRAMRKMKAMMRDMFGVEFKPYKVCRCESEPADIAGVVVTREKVVVRAKTFIRARRSILRLARKPGSLNIARRVVSYFGWLKNTRTFMFRRDNDVYAALRNAKALIKEHDRKMRLMACQ